MASGSTYVHEITAVDLTSKKAKCRGVCGVKYQSEAESTLEGRKTSLNVAFSHSHSLWHKERKAHAEAFNALKIYNEDRILEKKKFICLLISIVIIWHFYKTLWTQI